MKHVAGVILLNPANEVLLLKRKDSGYWTVPGGKPEEGEAPHVTAWRECQEETGLDLARMGVHAGMLRPVYFSHATLRDLGNTHILYYAARIVVTPEVENAEPDKHDAVAWMPLCKTATAFIWQLKDRGEWMNDRDRMALHNLRCMVESRESTL